MKSFEEKLSEASAGWVRDGLIQETQRAALLARHPVPEPTSHRFIATLSTLGVVLLAVGVSLTIAAHWEDTGDWTKIVSLLVLLVGTHAAAWRLAVAPGRYPRVGEALFMGGAILFLLGIALVSQVFHLNSRPPSGVLLWWLGIVALPWLLRAKGVQCVSVAAFVVWLGLELDAGDSWLRLTASDASWQAWPGFFVAFLVVGGALLFFGSGLRATARANFAGLHEDLGLVIACAALFALSFTWSRVVDVTWRTATLRLEPFAVVVALAAWAIAWSWRARGRGAWALGWFLVPALLPAAGFVLDPGIAGGQWLWGAAASIALFVLNLGMIRTGVAAGRESWVNLGIAFIAFNILARYFDLFGTMLEGGLFFVVTGLLVLGLGIYLEKKRRALMGALRKEVA